MRIVQSCPEPRRLPRPAHPGPCPAAPPTGRCRQRRRSPAIRPALVPPRPVSACQAVVTRQPMAAASAGSIQGGQRGQVGVGKRHGDLFGKGAVLGEPRQRLIGADGLSPAGAGRTVATGENERRDHPVARLPVADARADCQSPRRNTHGPGYAAAPPGRRRSRHASRTGRYRRPAPRAPRRPRAVSGRPACRSPAEPGSLSASRPHQAISMA